MSLDSQRESWERSYRSRQNFVFYPHEEVIRFVSKYVRKKIGLEEFVDLHGLDHVPRVLDLGCGIGRHVIYACQMGLEAYGADHSETAIALARTWAARSMDRVEERLRQADVVDLPWADGFFDFVVSHGVLCSMPFAVARAAIAEVSRVLRKDGLFYCDLASGAVHRQGREFAGEETVTSEHEQGTVQSYFNFGKVERLIAGSFEMVEAILVTREGVLSGERTARYHLVLKNMGRGAA